jgi:hypothetical protein
MGVSQGRCDTCEEKYRKVNVTLVKKSIIKVCVTVVKKGIAR